LARNKAAYAGREQAYVKHYLLETYLERLVHKTASRFDHIVYVDGYSGPWQSAEQGFEDTSFGIALAALRKAKVSWAGLGRPVQMVAHLVEQSQSAYAALEKIPAQYPDVSIYPHKQDFRRYASEILQKIPENAFVFILIDPKGWRINLSEISALLRRPNTEVIFNFMFEFINRAVSMSDPLLSTGLDELIPYGDWRDKISSISDDDTDGPSKRKRILIEAFSESLRVVGGYDYVAETPVLRPIRDRTLYSLVYATRKAVGLEVFRDCQVATLGEQEIIRGEAKVRAVSDRRRQFEMFSSFAEMAPDETAATLEAEKVAAETLLMELLPAAPVHMRYGDLWPQVLARHVVRKKDVGDIVARLKASGAVHFLDWAPKKRRPDDNYRVSRAP